MASSRMKAAAIPVDVWALILQYGVNTTADNSGTVLGYGIDAAGGYGSPPEPAPGSPHLCVTSELFLLCRSLTAALDEWYLLQLMERGLKGSAPVLQLAPGLLHKWERERTPLSSQKRSVLALSRAPKELLASIRRTEGRFLCNGDEVTPRQESSSVTEPFRKAFEALSTSMVQLSVLDGPFLRGSPWLRVVDLQRLQSLTEIGNGFLSFSSVEEVCLPVSLQRVGDDFLSGSPITALDLSHTALESVGHRFMGNILIATHKILWPRALKKVGDHFLHLQVDEWTPQEGGRLDLSQTQLESVGAGALVGCAWSEILLPQTLKAIGNNFLLKARAKRIDLTGAYLESIGTHCLCSAWTQEIYFPSSLTKVGDDLFFGVTMERVVVAADRLAEVGDEFLAQANVQVIDLPSSLKKAGRFFLRGCPSAQLDLSQTAIEHIEDYFLAGGNVEALKLPPSLTSVGTDFLWGTSATRIEISGGALPTVGSRFLASSKVSYLQLPDSLKRVGPEFLADSTAKRIDLSDSSVEVVGDYFLAHGSVEELWLPATMTSVGNSFLTSSTATRIVVDAAALLELGDFCFSVTPVEDLILPPSLQRVGKWFACDCTSTKLRVVADGLVEAGEGFLAECGSIPKESIQAPSCLWAQWQSEAAVEEKEGEEEEDAR